MSKIQITNLNFKEDLFNETRTIILNYDFKISYEKSFPNKKYKIVDDPSQLTSFKNNLKKLYSLYDDKKLSPVSSIKNSLQIIIRNATLKKLHSDIDNLHEECKEEDFELFSETARQNAKQILNTAYSEFPDYDYDIYPTEDQEIAIDYNSTKGRGLLILCDSKGGIAYFSTFDTKNSRFRCDDIKDFPYELLSKEFKKFNTQTKPFSPQSSYSYFVSFKKLNKKVETSGQSTTSQQYFLGA